MITIVILLNIANTNYKVAKVIIYHTKTPVEALKVISQDQNIINN